MYSLLSILVQHPQRFQFIWNVKCTLHCIMFHLSPKKVIRPIEEEENQAGLNYSYDYKTKICKELEF